MSARRSDLLRLKTIIDCIDEVERTVSELGVTEESYSFPQGTMETICRRGIDMLMLQLCEEAREVTDETRSHMISIPWPAIAEVRNYFVHSYGSIDASQVWGFIEDDLPELRAACAGCADEIERGDYSPSHESRTGERRARERESRG